MRRCLTALLVVGLISMNSRDAAAQPSAQDVAAWIGLQGTPVGALTPLLVSPGTKGEKSFNNVSGRFSHYSPSAGDGSNSIGGTFYHQAGMNAAVSGTVGYLTCDGCDATLMLGGDVHSTLWNNAAAKSNTLASVNLQGSLGFGSTDGAKFASLALGVPLAITMEQASKARISAFITPGFGWGRTAIDGFDAESGTRPMIGAGASWTAVAGWGLHASFQKIMIEDGGNSMGIGFSYQLGAR